MKEIKKYVADDGKQFDTAGECEMYEHNMQCDARYMLKGIPYHMVDQEDFYGGGGSNCCYYLILYLQNRDQVDRFMMWMDSNGSHINTNAEELIGETVFVDVYTGCENGDVEDIESVYGYRTEDEMICNSIRTIMHYAKLAVENAGTENKI